MSWPSLAVLVSGNGSNLQAILDEVSAGRIPASIRVVVSNKKKAYALERARNAGVEAVHCSAKPFDSREAYDEALVKILQERSIDWVVCAGFMRILGSKFVRPYWGRILNIHPALLPKYPGVDSIQRAFEAGDKEVGVTVHFIDEGVDTGPIILQEAIAVKPDDTLETLTERVHRLEHQLYPKALRKVLTGEVTMKEAQ